MSFPGKYFPRWEDTDESTLSANVYPRDGSALLVPLGSIIRRAGGAVPVALPNKKKKLKRIRNPIEKAFQALEAR